jgi:CubicO group peptidase (beta-lactamase class C family)
VYLLAALAVTTTGARAQEAKPAPAAMTADTPSKTASGATFMAPAGWVITTTPTMAVLSPPEPDTHIAIVEVGQAVDGTSAAAQAWALYRPDAKRVFKLATPRPARNGWDERQVIDYETSPNDHLAIQAVALRSGARWTVMIFDSSEATAEKRGAAVGLIGQSLRPAGYERETFAGRTAHPLDAARIKAIKSFVRTAMSDAGVPGVGLALIENGKIVYEGGLGVREQGKPAPVDAHTLFMIASNTKSMSTLLLAQLVDEGKLSWDQPVTQVYPSFRLGSAETTKKVLVRHLVCACTGLPREDMEWIFNTSLTTPASTTFDQLAKTEPTSGFGEVFQYNNLMASAAGYVGGYIVHPDREIGAGYDAAMQERIFNPLGMKDTTFSFKRALAADHASPHAWNVHAQPSVSSVNFNLSIEPYRPAGGAWSSAHDMALYVQNELALGKLPSGKQLVSAKNLLVRRAPGVPTGEDRAYGMGLEQDATWGVKVIHHGGSMVGYKSDIIFLPDVGVGAVILTNADEGNMLLRPFMRRLLEVMYDGKPEAAADVAARGKLSKTQIAKEMERLAVPPAPAEVAELAGAYFSQELGQLKVSRLGKDVVFDFGEWKSKIASRKNDDGTTSLLTIDPGVLGFEFVVANRDGKRALTTRDSQHEYIYLETK